VNYNFVKKLRACQSPAEVYMLLKEFDDGGNLLMNKYFSSYIEYTGSSGYISKYHISLKGLPELAYRLLVFLKFNGFLRYIPLGEGKGHYLSNLHILLTAFMKEIDNLILIEDIDCSVIDKYIKSCIKKGQLAQTIISRLDTIKEWIIFGNEHLPYFLRINSEIVTASTKYASLKELVRKQNIENNDNKSLKLFDLKDLKTLVSDAIIFVKEHNEEVLNIATVYANNKLLNRTERNRNLRHYLKNNDFNESTLQELRKKILDKELIEFDIYSMKICIDLIKRLEISCISIALMLTGMRVSELISLDRDLNITNDEYYNLTRIIYKTAPTKEGIPLSIPIPKICKISLEILSQLAYIKDPANKYKCLILNSIDVKKVNIPEDTRINRMLKWYCNKHKLKNYITSHQFRHSLAYIVSCIYKSDGLEIVKLILGHTSIDMTLEYMGNYNPVLKEVFKEFRKADAENSIEKIIDQINQNKKIFGEKGMRLMPNHKFSGKYVKEFTILMKKALIKLIEEEKLTIIQTPVSLCIHDVSKPEELACQRGLDILDIVARGPAPARCRGANCSNSIFLEEHIKELKSQMYAEVEPELKKRLEQNTYFIEAGGFEQEPFRKLIKEYDDYKKGIS
jgi:integrase